ncbi:MAG: hypothetical protein AAF517_12505 [Planctomycetota bacterium]
MTTDDPQQTSSADTIGATRLGIALFSLSTATVLFTLAIFRLLSFFIMPSLFFDLLFVGFPLGAFLGVRFFRPSDRSFRSSLWVLQGSMIASIIATLWCKDFDYLRANLFNVQLDRLIIQMGTFTALFIPFFCSYGLSEYIGYQVGRSRLQGRMPLVYALYLFGAAAAYVFVESTISALGVGRHLVLSILLVAFAARLIAPRGIWRHVLSLELAALIIATLLPTTVEESFLDQYKGDGLQSTKKYRADGYEPRFQSWGRYSLTEVMYSPQRDQFAGFYNDLMQWEYSKRFGFTDRSLGMLPINLAPSGASIAVIGAGGGRQVKWALSPRFDFRRILALEVEPAVFEAVRGTLAEDFGNVYEDPRVEPVIHEARSYMEASTESFDLIYLPSVGGYPQMMLEPGNMIRTSDAYQTLRDRLTERGVLAVWYPRGLDPQGVLTNQYVRTLRSNDLKLNVAAYVSDEDFLILASKSPLSIDVAAATEFLTEPASDEFPLAPNPSAVPRPLFVTDDPDYQPITDEQPFLAGNVRHIFSLGQVTKLFSIVAGLVALVGGLLTFSLRKSGDPKIPGRSYLQVAGLSFLIGANFLILERFAILALFRKIYMFHDALLLGAISFLVLSGLGSVLIRPTHRGVFQMLGAICLVALIALEPLSPTVTLLLVAPVAFVTGSFFPALFERAAGNPLAVFALDAVGAALGSLLAFFLPIALGFHYFFPVAAVVFIATALGSHAFFRSADPSPTTDVSDTAPSVAADTTPHAST